ncbi:MAG: AAA domain-containing protein [Spirochaeta sp.]|nr:AAA domain-containing protein [Spirochaeta sp.]
MSTRVEDFQERYRRIKEEISRMIVGQEDIIDGILISLFCGGHALLEGIPGLGKTSIIKSLGEVLALEISRIQFTPDLMPADIIGTNILMQDELGNRLFQFQKGPLFANIVLADEINRATPKTQSALLEAMQEQRITVSGKTHRLSPPFIVLATQNPIEMEGTYPLPEAQMDRFFFKLIVEYPSVEQMSEILDKTTCDYRADLNKVGDSVFIEEAKELIRLVPLAGHVQDYCVRLTQSTRPGTEYSSAMAEKYIRYGSSPRGAQSLVMAGKVKALLAGRFNVSFEDIKSVVQPSLRHRIILNFEGEAEGQTVESILDDILAHTPEVVDGKKSAS